jgi:tripartite-type tricarboxylate transporter receptor subunit TctC
MRLFPLLARTLAGLALASAGLFAHAADYPAKPVNLIVPYAPGGVTDGLSRQVSLFLGKELNQAVPVDNRPGGSATVGGRLLATAKPDGYTIGVFDATGITVTPQLFRQPPYDSLKAFQPVTRLGNNYQIIVAHPNAPASTLKELIEHARKHPDTPVATPGAVGINIIEFARLGQMARFSMNNVGYNGSAPLLQDVMAGQIQFAFLDVASAMNFVKTGKVKAIAVTSKQRLDLLPDVPTVAESGYPDYEAIAWFGVLAPAGTPADVVKRLDQALQKFGRSKEYADWARERSFVPALSENPEAFSRVIQEEITRYTRISKQLNLSIN